MNPTLSIIIPTCNRLEHLRRCLDAVIATTPPIRYEVIVVDGSEPPLEQLDGARVLREQHRGGFSHACNIGCRAARGRFVCWLNDDAEPQPGWAETAVTFMDAPENEDVALGALEWRDAEVTEKWDVQYYEHVLNANFGIIRYEWGERVKWFDERIRMYGVDCALAASVLVQGGRLARIRGARILHHRLADRERTRRNQQWTKIDRESFFRYHSSNFKTASRLSGRRRGQEGKENR